MQDRKNQSIIWSISKDEFESLVKKSETIADILRYFNMNNKGGNHATVKRRVKLENIDISHISLGRGSNKGKRFNPKKTNDEYFCENSSANRHHIKKRIIKNNLIKYECSACGLANSWNNKELVLQLEHKNGIPNDNRLENLCFLCPNCHSQTDTYAGKRFKKPSKIKKGRSGPKTWLRKVERPSKKDLDKLIKQYPMTTIGKMYGVSDNAIRKWKKYYDKFGN